MSEWWKLLGLEYTKWASRQ